MNSPKRPDRRERTTWIILTAVLAFCLTLAVLAPTVFAQSAKQDTQGYVTTFQNVFDFVLDNYVDELDPQILYEGAMKGMMEAIGDPHSLYLDEAMVSDLKDTTVGKYGGVGLYISKQTVKKDKNGRELEAFIEIVSPIEDTPGWKAGLEPGDLIIKVNDESTAGMTTDDAVKRLRGTPGSDVVVTIRRGENFEFKAVLKRALIEVPTVKRAMLPDGSGYLRIIEFSTQTAQRVKEAIEYFQANKYKALVIDLRNNPGGLLQSVVNISDFFLSEGVIVSTKSRNAQETVSFQAKPDLLVPKEMPIVVLINKGSASASEILSGALKDQGRAYVIGEKSYGKGSVQQVFPLGKTGIKLTMSRYYTPSDVNIDKIGINPDREVKDRDFTDEEVKSYQKITENNSIQDFVKAYSIPSQAEIESFVRGLKAGGINLEDRLLKKLIRDEVNRKTIAPVFDLEYDIVLQEAVKIIDTENFGDLLKTVKTLKEVQDAASQAKSKETNGAQAEAGGLKK